MMETNELPSSTAPPRIQLATMRQLAEATARQDNWTGTTNAPARRRAQTRLNTRAYRKFLRVGPIPVVIWSGMFLTQPQANAKPRRPESPRRNHRELQLSHHPLRRPPPQRLAPNRWFQWHPGTAPTKPSPFFLPPSSPEYTALEPPCFQAAHRRRLLRLPT